MEGQSEGMDGELLEGVEGDRTDVGTEHPVDEGKQMSRDCAGGTICPYAGGRSIRQVVAEWQWQWERIAVMEQAVAAATTEIERLREDNRLLKDEQESLRFKFQRLHQKQFREKVKLPENVPAATRSAPVTREKERNGRHILIVPWIPCRTNAIGAAGKMSRSTRIHSVSIM
jgi:hypothetical protein